MPRSAAGKAAREQKKLTAAAAWKNGHVGGRGGARWRNGGGRGGRGGRGGGRWAPPPGPGSRARAPEPESRPGAAPSDARDDARDDDASSSDDDPVAAVGSGDAYRALLASLRGDGEDEEYADALRARDGDDEDDDEDDDDEVDDDSRETADDEDAEEGSARASAPIPEDRRDPEGRSSRPLDPEEIDEDPSDDSDADADDADAEDPASDSDPSPSAAASRPSAADDDSASGGLATHLARVVDDRTAARLASLKKPEWARATPARDELRVPASSRKKGLSRGKAPSSRRPLDEDDAWESGGAWELDASARADGAAEALTDAPAAPEGLPPKLLERWNATRRSSSSSDAFPAPPPSKKKRAGNEDDARSPPSGPAASNRALPFASRAQAELYALLDQYRDVFYPARAYPGAPSDAPGAAEATDAVLLHVARHVLRTRRRVTKNNEALARRAKAEEAAREAKRLVERRERLAIGDEGGEGPEGGSKDDPKDPGGGSKKEGPKGGSKGGSNARKPARVKVSDDLPRDQGFARPTVLILVPMRNVAGRLVRRLLEFLPSANTGKADAVSKLDRLAEDFGGRFDDELDDRETEKRRKKGAWVPEDHAGTFRGNVDDHFRLGVKVTKASVRLFVDFFGSDVLIASPLGEYARSSPRDKGLFFFFFFFWGVFPLLPPPPSSSDRRAATSPRAHIGDESVTKTYHTPKARAIVGTHGRALAACGRTLCSLLARDSKGGG